MNMKLAVVALSAALALEAFSARAGDVNLLGNLSVNSNLTAQSITLGGVTQTNWNFLPLQGYRHVIVPEGTNDIHRGNNLLAAYATAVTLGANVSNRVCVIVPPGTYNLNGTTLSMNSNYVDLIGLVPAQMTTKQLFADWTGRKRSKTIAAIQCPVSIYGASVAQGAGNVRIESVNLAGGYTPNVASTNTLLRHVAMVASTGSVNIYAGTYIDCVAGNNSFGGDTSGNSGVASGTFIDCVGGTDSFGYDENDDGDDVASGTFIDCTAGDHSFGFEGQATGSLTGCLAGDFSFASDGGTASGTFVDCVAGDESFGGATGAANGTFIDCVAGIDSFGGNGTIGETAKLRHCAGGEESFSDFETASDDFNYNINFTNYSY